MVIENYHDMMTRNKLKNLKKKKNLTRNQKRKLQSFLEQRIILNNYSKKRKLTGKKQQKIYSNYNNILMDTENSISNQDTEIDINESIKLDENDTIVDEDEENTCNSKSTQTQKESIILDINEEQPIFDDCYIISSSDDDDDDILIIDDESVDTNKKNYKDINRTLLEDILRTKLRSSIQKQMALNFSKQKKMLSEYDDDNLIPKPPSNLTELEKKKIKETELQIKEINDKSIPEKIKILLSDIPIQTKAIIIKKLELLESLENSGSEYKKLREWIDNILKIPFGKYCSFDLSKKNDYKIIGDRLCNIKEILNKAVYGHEQVKEALVELVAKWVSNPPSKGHALAIVGPAGVGKTSLFREGLAKALSRPFCSFSLAGLSDESYLSGFAHTYEGSDFGRICRMLTETDCMNPIIFMDELDKIDTTRHGSSVVNKLIEIIDFSQNHEYEDMYFGNIKIDLSRVLFVFSLNYLENIDPILKDRLEIIKVNGFENKEKIEILKHYVIPKELEQINLTKNDIIFPENTLIHILRKIRKEDGIREAKRAIQIIIRKINLLQYINDADKKKMFTYYSKRIILPITITNKLVNKLLKEEPMPEFLRLYI